MGDKLKEFLAAIGAISEIGGCLRDALMSNGFTREEACDIVKGVIVKSIYSDKESRDE